MSSSLPPVAEKDEKREKSNQNKIKALRVEKTRHCTLTSAPRTSDHSVGALLLLQNEDSLFVREFIK